MEEAEFDKFAAEYRTLHAESIKASGESPEYFAEYKIVDVAAELARARGGVVDRAAVLDFGAGVGYSVPFFGRHMPRARVTCLDVSQKSLDIGAAKHGGVADFRHFDGKRIPYPDGTFDVALASCVFHHIPHSEHVELLAEIRRVLAPERAIARFRAQPLESVDAPRREHLYLRRARGADRRADHAPAGFGRGVWRRGRALPDILSALGARPTADREMAHLAAARRAVLCAGDQGFEGLMRALIVAAVLALLPAAVYWQTATHEYGFRDDYAHLRESHEEPGKLVRLTISNGRPVYGAVLVASLRGVEDVRDLVRLRFMSVALLSGVGLVLWGFLRRSGWGDLEAGAIGAGVALLPGAQVVVGWAIAWPIALGLLAALLGFWLVEAHLGKRGVRRVAGVLAGAGLYFIAGLTYQTSALFTVVPLAALLLVREDERRFGHARWVVTHLGLLFASLVVGLLVMDMVFSEGVVPEAARMRIEPHPLLKLLWFVRNPLPNALGLFELRDQFATQPWFWIVTAVFGAIMLLGFVYGGNTRSQQAALAFLPARAAVRRSQRESRGQLASDRLSHAVAAVGPVPGVGRIRDARRGSRRPRAAGSRRRLRSARSCSPPPCSRTTIPTR